VNVLGNIFRYYLNADLPPSGNEMDVSGVLGTEPVEAGSAEPMLDAGTRQAPGQPPSTERTNGR